MLVFDDKLEELSWLYQVSNVVAYMAQFEGMMNEVEDQSEEALITFFLGGLKSETRNQLKLQRSASLRKAYTMAKVFEAQKSHKYLKSDQPSKSKVILPTSTELSMGVPIVRQTLSTHYKKTHFLRRPILAA